MKRFHSSIILLCDLTWYCCCCNMCCCVGVSDPLFGMFCQLPACWATCSKVGWGWVLLGEGWFPLCCCYKGFKGFYYRHAWIKIKPEKNIEHLSLFPGWTDTTLNLWFLLETITLFTCSRSCTALLVRLYISVVWEMLLMPCKNNLKTIYNSFRAYCTNLLYCLLCPRQSQLRLM